MRKFNLDFWVPAALYAVITVSGVYSVASISNHVKSIQDPEERGLTCIAVAIFANSIVMLSKSK